MINKTTHISGIKKIFREKKTLLISICKLALKTRFLQDSFLNILSKLPRAKTKNRFATMGNANSSMESNQDIRTMYNSPGRLNDLGNSTLLLMITLMKKAVKKTTIYIRT